MSQVEAQQGREVVADTLHIAALMDGGVVLVVGFPSDAINGVVVVSEQIHTAVAQGLEVGEQILRTLCPPAVGQRVVSFFLAIATAHSQ